MRLPGLDGLRAVSIALVLIAHLGNMQGPTRFGVFGVHVFFVISGFLITHLLCAEEKRNGKVDISAFYRRRAFRILPPAFAYLLAVATFTTLPDLLASALFFRNLTVGQAVTSHFWSLAIEEQFYLVWPGFMVLFGRRRFLVTVVLIALAPVWREVSYLISGGPQFVNTQRFDLRFDALLMGCALALLRHRADTSWLRTGVMQSRWLVFASVASLAFSVTGAISFPLAQTAASIAIALVVNYAVEHSGGLLNWAPMVWLGQLSYSLYLWQQLFCWRSPFEILGTFPLNLFAALFMACISFYSIERTSLRWRDRLAPICTASASLTSQGLRP